MDIAIVLIAAASTILLLCVFFVIRHLVHFSGIKKHSRLYIEIMSLNDKYISLLNEIHEAYAVEYVRNSLKRFRNNNDESSIMKYLCGCVRESEEKWQKLLDMAAHNKTKADDYISEYEVHRENLAENSYSEIKSVIPMSEKRYKKLENMLCKEILLRPVTNVKIKCIISYTSPQGQNSYSSSWLIDLNKVFEKLGKTKEHEQSIEYQRALMTDSKRYDILKRDNFMCKICGRTADEGAKLEVDHIIPVSKGGKTVDSNLQTLCKECNRGKGAKL